jgi:hypothetical protein
MTLIAVLTKLPLRLASLQSAAIKMKRVISISSPGLHHSMYDKELFIMLQTH